MNVNRERIKQQSKDVAEYMAKPHKYNVTWTCPHCGNCHSWWWEDEFEAHDDGEVIMTCDRCDAQTWCKGDGNGLYEPSRWELKETESDDLEQRVSDLEELEKDLHNYVRGLETKVNTNNQLAFDAINTVTMRLVELENEVAEHRALPKKGKEEKEKKESFLDLIHGKKPPFHERIREGCQLEDMDGITLASIIRFVAVEVERMTERDMGGSFTISNLKVSANLRQLADEAEISDCPYRDDEEDEEGPGWGPHGWEGEDE